MKDTGKKLRIKERVLKMWKSIKKWLDGTDYDEYYNGGQKLVQNTSEIK